MLELLGDFIEEPERAAAAVRERPPIALALGAYLAGAVSLYLAQALAGRFMIFGSSPMGLGLACVWHVALAVLLCALLHLVCEGFGASGRASGLFVLLGLSDLGWALALPGALVLQAVAPGWSIGGSLLMSAVGLLTLTLKARSISHHYGLSRAKAWAALAAPYAAVVVLCALSFSLAVFGAVSHVLKLVS